MPFTVTLSAAVPPVFVQVMVNVLEGVARDIVADSVPLLTFVPDQSPDAMHEAAPEEVHDKRKETPLVTDIGPSEFLAFILTVGGITQDCVSSGLLTKEPHPLLSVQVLV